MGDFDHLEGHDPAAEEAVVAEPKKKDDKADVKQEKPAESSSSKK